MDKLIAAVVWVVMLALIVLAFWLPGLLPAGVRLFIGHAVLSLAGIAAVVLYLASGFARSMRS